MARVTRGFVGRPRDTTSTGRVPPGQYLTRGFPVLSAGPTPQLRTDDWSLAVTGQVERSMELSWEQLMGLPQRDVTGDIHCVTKWSKLDTSWRGVSVDDLLADVVTDAEYVLVGSYGGYTTNLPLADLLDGKAWVVHSFDGRPLDPEHGGPARLLVPHLYFWKSAKWVNELQLLAHDRPGFWETYGYHSYGDPWREQRYAGD
jgi:DMSO/TMAO reductase YedYZ molybdopterin-dependent catalytic subunit